MPRLVVMRGLPGSDKTGSAKKYIERDNSFTRVSRQDIRRLLFLDDKIIPAREKLVALMEHYLIYALMLHERSVIVDDHNLNDKTMDNYTVLANSLKVQLQILRKDLPLEQCLKNNKHKANPLKEEVIVKLYKKYFKPKVEWSNGKSKPTNQEYVVYFIEDVLADISSRRKDSGKDSGISGDQQVDCMMIHNDKLIKKYAQKVQDDFNMGFRVVLIGIRPEYCRGATLGWLNYLAIPFSKLILKPDDQKIDDDVFRLEAVVDDPDFPLCKKIVDTKEFVETFWKRHDIDTESPDDK